MGQTITLKSLGFHVAPGAAPTVIGIGLSDGAGIIPFGTNITGAALVSGSITVLGQQSVPEPGALALLGGLLVPGAAFLIRRVRA